MQSLLILGRQPALGLAELESLYGAAAVRPAVSQAAASAVPFALLDVPAADVDFSRLGGSLKLARVLTTIDSIEWRDIEKHLIDSAPHHAEMLPEGKLTIGLSVYGLRVNPATINATGLSIKKAIRKSASKGDAPRPVRLVPNKELELNTAQVMHNNLADSRSGNAWELLLVHDGNKTILAQTTAVQDIDSYTLRDRGRPKRDARVGMLPPKLAQIIINLAVADTDPKFGGVVLDPFCGTGVLLQEASLMGFDIYGSDLDKRMVEYTDTNLQWLLTLRENRVAPHSADNRYYGLEQGDATTHTWKPIPNFVACETYLGRPFTAVPDGQLLHQTVSEVTLILKKFLRNIGTQIPKGTRLCLAVPAWQTRPGQFKHLPLLDQIAQLGYNRISFEHVRNEDLLYYRADQVVARELLILEKR